MHSEHKNKKVGSVKLTDGIMTMNFHRGTILPLTPHSAMVQMSAKHSTMVQMSAKQMKNYDAKPNESERDRSRRTIAIAWNRHNILYNSRIDTRIIQDGRRRPRNEEILSVMKLLAFREKWGRSPRFWACFFCILQGNAAHTVVFQDSSFHRF